MALEARAESADLRIQQLQSALADLQARLPPLSFDTELLRQRILNLEAENTSLRAQVDALRQAQAGIGLDALISAFGLSAAIGEATMPDRSVGSLGASVQSQVILGAAGPILRFPAPDQPTLIDGLSTVNFAIDKVPGREGQAAPRSLYTVLLDKQAVYARTAWSGAPGAVQIVALCGAALANTATWSFASIVALATSIARQEQTLEAVVARLAPGSTAANYTSAVDAISALLRTASGKSVPVAGDLLALSAALDASTSIARSVSS